MCPSSGNTKPRHQHFHGESKGDAPATPGNHSEGDEKDSEDDEKFDEGESGIFAETFIHKGDDLGFRNNVDQANSSRPESKAGASIYWKRMSLVLRSCLKKKNRKCRF